MQAQVLNEQPEQAPTVFEWNSIFQTHVTFGHFEEPKRCISCGDPIEGLTLEIVFNDGRADNDPRDYCHNCAPTRFFKKIA